MFLKTILNTNKKQVCQKVKNWRLKKKNNNSNKPIYWLNLEFEKL